MKGTVGEIVYSMFLDNKSRETSTYGTVGILDKVFKGTFGTMTDGRGTVFYDTIIQHFVYLLIGSSVIMKTIIVGLTTQ